MITHAPDDEDGNNLDPVLLARATAICRDEKQRSISLLQRRMRLGYTAASDLLDAIIERSLDAEE
jgi:hypothetical protein